MKTVVIWMAIVSLMAITHTPQAAVMESPNQGVNLSGIGFISGWKCNATDITVTINEGEHLSVAMHQERGDLINVCGSSPHGFIKQVNWAWPHVSDGEHTVVAYDEGAEFGRATFTVGTLGEEFATGLKKQITVEDFPSPGEHTMLGWNESTQHFEVLYTLEEEPDNDYENPTSSSGGLGVLESPNQGVNLSGVGFISGWKCNATNITVTINDGEHLSVAMHQERGDLIGVCGSSPHGFIKQVNWAWPHVSDGKHTVVAYDEGVEFGRATFTVGTLGEEFAKGLEKRIIVEDFPSPGEYTVLEWNESTQHFEVVSVLGGEPGNNYDDAFWNAFDDSRGFYGVPWEEDLLYAEVPNVDNCQAGKLTELAKNRALEAANQIRSLHGLAPLKYSAFYDNQTQESSLIQQANNSLNHVPPPSSKCYTEEGYEGARSSNLAGGTKNRDPAASLIGLASDANNGGNLAGVGHRRALLYPFNSYFSYGQVENVGTQKTNGFLLEPELTPQINVDFVAYPYGVFPQILLYGDPPWSFSVILDKTNQRNNIGDFLKDATVTVKRVSDEEELHIYNHYVKPYVLTWQVEGWEYDTLYEVDIKNVTLNDGTTRDYSYSVFIKQPDIDNY